MASLRKSANAAICLSNGVRNGHAIGRTLNTVQKNAADQANEEIT